MVIRKLILLRGLPGSTKSTLARKYKDKYKDDCYIFSTDDYWIRPDGYYDFSYELLSQSHKWNQERVKNTVVSASRFFDTIIVVDNTNITFKEMKPYIELALHYGFEVEFEEPNCDWKYDVEKCFRKNTHGVPYATILRMSQKWEDHVTVVAKLEDLKK